MLQRIVVILIDIVVHFLEASVGRQSIPDDTNTEGKGEESFFSSQNDQHNGTQRNEKSQEKQLQEAYRFMELRPPITKEVLNRQYKKLSLRYHPDRNGGSEESKANFQKLGASVKWIEKDISGLAGENEINGHDGSDDDGDNDDFVAEIRRRQEAQRRYREMQEERERAMQEELKRQDERKHEFKVQVKEERDKCHQQKRQWNMGGNAGRMSAHREFQQQAEEVIASRDRQTENDPSSPTEEPLRQQPKPRNFIMECNMNEIVIALRLNMPEIVFQLMNQELPVFAQNKAAELYLDEKTVTAATIKKAYMLQGLDEDDNNLLHYAVYYECYPVVNMICGTAMQSGYLEEILWQPNVHRNTTLFFAKIAEDRSIPRLIESLIKSMEEAEEAAEEERKLRTQIGPALGVAMQRVGGIFRNMTSVSTLDTVLSFGVTYLVFGMHKVTSALAIYLTNAVHTESNYVDEVPGIHGFSVHCSFCFLWTTARWLISSEWFRWELALLLTPIAMAVSSKKGSSVYELLLFPLVWHAKLSDQLEGLLLRNNQFIVPEIVTGKGFSRSYLIFCMTFIYLGLSKVLV